MKIDLDNKTVIIKEEIDVYDLAQALQEVMNEAPITETFKIVFEENTITFDKVFEILKP